MNLGGGGRSQGQNQRTPGSWYRWSHEVCFEGQGIAGIYENPQELACAWWSCACHPQPHRPQAVLSFVPFGTTSARPPWQHLPSQHPPSARPGAGPALLHLGLTGFPPVTMFSQPPPSHCGSRLPACPFPHLSTGVF